MKDYLVRRIEIAIARYWPDFQRIAEFAGVSVRRVHDAVDAMELEEPAPRRETGISPEQMHAAQREYERLVYRGFKIAEMPAWVREGHNAHVRSRHPVKAWVSFEPLRWYVESVTRKDAWGVADFLAQRGWTDGTWQAKAWQRARRCGRLTTATADQLACDLGMHPSQIWGEEWWIGERRTAS